jgi:two-component system response regulator AtoC
VILCDGDRIGVEHLQLSGLAAGVEPTLSAIAAEGGSLAEVASRAAAAAERLRIRDALRQAGGDRRRAAELLQVSPRTLSSRLRDLGLEGEGGAGLL